MAMKLVQIDKSKGIEQEFKILKVKIGDATVTLREYAGKLMIHGDDSDLMVQPVTANSFCVVTTPAFLEPSKTD